MCVSIGDAEQWYIKLRLPHPRTLFQAFLRPLRRAFHFDRDGSYEVR